MMMANIFFDLSTNMPEENYFTNSFAFLLQTDKELFAFFLESLLKKLSVSQRIIESLRKERFDIKTQVPFQMEKTIVDIHISAGVNFQVFMENKLRGPVFLSQVKKYLDVKKNYLTQHEKAQAFVLFVTMTKNLPKGFHSLAKDENIIHCTWSEINELLRTFLARKKAETNKYYINS